MRRHVASAACHVCGGWQGRCAAGAVQGSLPSVVLAESVMSVLFLEARAISEMAGLERSMTSGCPSLSVFERHCGERWMHRDLGLAAATGCCAC